MLQGGFKGNSPRHDIKRNAQYLQYEICYEISVGYNLHSIVARKNDKGYLLREMKDKAEKRLSSLHKGSLTHSGGIRILV